MSEEVTAVQEEKEAKNFSRIIEISKDEEFKIKIESMDEFDKSFFNEVYEKAAQNVIEIIDNTQEYYESKRFNKNDFLKYKDKEEKNNIIAFIGERGAGKTSAMLSFAGALKQLHKTTKNESKILAGIRNEQCKFKVLDIVDPSLFEKEESVFQVILAKLFEDFRQKIKSENENIEKKNSEQRELLKQFKQVYANFNQIALGGRPKEARDLEEILEALSNLAAGSNMRNSFMELVRDLLQYEFGSNTIEKSFLVIPIDDLDMNIHNAAQMAEQIRKYLLIPNVIVLMAVKVEQLTDSIEQMFIEEYEVFLKYGRQLAEDTNIMAARYIEKLIPNGKKIYLPSLRTVNEAIGVKVVIDNGANPKIQKAAEDMQKVVLGTILRKTGLIFLKPKEGVHKWIPDNLRELQNFMALLNKLGDISLHPSKVNDKNNKRNMKYNLEILEGYFNNVWLKRNLSIEDIKILEELKNLDIEKKNKFILGHLYEKNLILVKKHTRFYDKTIKEAIELKEGQGLINEENKDIRDLKEQYNKNNYNVSLGDIIDGLVSDEEYEDETSRKFKFAVQVIYSIEIFRDLYVNNDSEGTYRLVAGDVIGEVRRLVIRKEKGINARSEFVFENYGDLNVIFNVNYEEGNSQEDNNPKDKGQEENNISKKNISYTFSMPLKIAINYLCYNNLENKNLDKKGFGKYNEIYVKCKKFGETKWNNIGEVETEFLNREVYHSCLETIRRIHYFIFPIYSKESRQIVARKYDIEAWTGVDMQSKAQFSLLGFVSRLLWPERLNKIVLKNGITNNGNFKFIDEEIERWVDSYITVLPIYSIEFMLEIRKKYTSYSEYMNDPKIKMNDFYQYIVYFFERLEKKIETDILEDMIMGETYIMEALKNCPIVKEISKDNMLKDMFNAIWDRQTSDIRLEDNNIGGKQNRDINKTRKLDRAFKELQGVTDRTQMKRINRLLNTIIEQAKLLYPQVKSVQKYQFNNYEEKKIIGDRLDEFRELATEIVNEVKENIAISADKLSLDPPLVD